MWAFDGSEAFFVEDVGFSLGTPHVQQLGPDLYYRGTGAEGTKLYGLSVQNGTLNVNLVPDPLPDGRPGSGPIFAPRDLTPFARDLYFAASGPVGEELYRVDGDTKEAFLVEDIQPGPSSSDPELLTLFRSELYFPAEGALGSGIYKADQGANVTFVGDVNPSGSGRPEEFQAFQGDLYFVARESRFDRAIFRIDGETGEIDPTFVRDSETSRFGDEPAKLTVFQDDLYFTLNPFSGSRVLKLEGETHGVVQVSDAHLGLDILDFPEAPFFSFGRGLYMNALDEVSGYELHKVDGTTGAFLFVEDIHPGGSSSFPQKFFSFSGDLYFMAQNASDGRFKLHTLDGETELINDIQTVDFEQIRFPTSFVVVDGGLYFIANADTTSQIGDIYRMDQSTGEITVAAEAAAFGLTLFNPRQP